MRRYKMKRFDLYLSVFRQRRCFFLHVLIAVTKKRTSFASFSADNIRMGKNRKNRQPNQKKKKKNPESGQGKICKLAGQGLFDETLFPGA